MEESIDFSNFSLMGYILFAKESVTYVYFVPVHVNKGPFANDSSLVNSENSYFAFWLALLYYPISYDHHALPLAQILMLFHLAWRSSFQSTPLYLCSFLCTVSKMTFRESSFLIRNLAVMWKLLLSLGYLQLLTQVFVLHWPSLNFRI